MKCPQSKWITAGQMMLLYLLFYGARFVTALFTLMTPWEAVYKCFLAICHHMPAHLFLFTVNCLLLRSPCLWSYKSLDKIQMCLFSRQGCASDKCKGIAETDRPPKLSPVTDLLTTHHAAVGCSRRVVSDRMCACVCLCPCACVCFYAIQCPWHLSDKHKSLYNHIYTR